MNLADVPTPEEQPKGSKRGRPAKQKKEQDKPEEEGRYGRTEFAPVCPHCSRREGKDYPLKVKSTKGPIVYWYCDGEGCKYPGTKTSRPWKPNRYSQQRDVRAREDM